MLRAPVTLCMHLRPGRFVKPTLVIFLLLPGRKGAVYPTEGFAR